MVMSIHRAVGARLSNLFLDVDNGCLATLMRIYMSDCIQTIFFYQSKR